MPVGGMNTSVLGNILVRAEVWSTEIKEVLEDELIAQSYVDWMDEFPDGDQFNIPSIGEAEVDDYVEDGDIIYRPLDLGEFTFTITDYKSSGTYVTRKAQQNTFYMNQLVSGFVPKQSRALMVEVEQAIFECQDSSLRTGGQTPDNANVINGADHRFVGTGTNETMAPEDFAKAKYALTKANVPMSNLVAIVDPSVGYKLETLSNIANVSNNPQWEGIISSGLTTGMRFIRNVYGFDVYESNYLADANETIGGLTTAAGKANVMFSAVPDVLPFKGAWRQMPIVDAEFNKDKQRDEFVTTARYGLKLYRPENLVTVLTDTDQV